MKTSHILIGAAIVGTGAFLLWKSKQKPATKSYVGNGSSDGAVGKRQRMTGGNLPAQDSKFSFAESKIADSGWVRADGQESGQFFNLKDSRWVRYDAVGAGNFFTVKDKGWVLGKN